MLVIATALGSTYFGGFRSHFVICALLVMPPPSAQLISAVFVLTLEFERGVSVLCLLSRAWWEHRAVKAERTRNLELQMVFKIAAHAGLKNSYPCGLISS